MSSAKKTSKPNRKNMVYIPDAPAVKSAEKQETKHDTKQDVKLQTSKYMMHEVTRTDFDTARYGLYKMGIKSAYDATRIIFSNTKKHDLSTVYSQECNGLILNRTTWKPLMVPPRSLCHNINTNKANEYLHQKLYTIKKALDGTSFNVYYMHPNRVDARVADARVLDGIYGNGNVADAQVDDVVNDVVEVNVAQVVDVADANVADVQVNDVVDENVADANRWVISTSLGYSMNQVSWDTDTYQSLIEESYGDSWQNFCKQLDTKKCYSFGFYNRKMHKFYGKTETSKEIAQPANRIWFIQSVDMDETSPTYLQASTEFKPSNVEGLPKIHEQELYLAPVDNIRDLYKRAANALAEYTKTGEVCYGFILRTNDYTKTTVHSDLYIESSLMRFIKKVWYDNDINKVCASKHWSKEKAVVLYSFLSAEVYDSFIYVFPQYKASFVDIETKIDVLCDEILSDSPDKSNVSVSLTQNFNKIKQSMTHMNKEQKKSILKNFIKDITNFEALYVYLYL